MRTFAASSSVVLAALACGDPPAEPRDPQAVYLTATEHLARASLVLRGVRPSPAELRAVAQDAALLPELVDGYLASDELGATLRELFNEVWQLKLQVPTHSLPPYPPIEGLSYNEVHHSIYEETLRLIEDVIVRDEPYTQIVTADYTMADPIVAATYGLPHSGRPRWERVRWQDGRGAAGVLTTNAPYLRYRTTAYNYNRGRANAFSRALLCHDFLEGEIHFDTRIDLADPDVVNSALTRDRACVGCHQTLDPFASYFFRFRQGPLGAPMLPLAVYREDTAGDWAGATGRAPAYFGRAAPDLTALGKEIARDARFTRCLVETLSTYLLAIPADDLPQDYATAMHDRLVGAELRAKALIRAIVLSPRFALAGHRDPAIAERTEGYRRLRPQQLARMVEELTGYRWRAVSEVPFAGRPIGPVDYLDDDLEGYRVLAGGIDSYYVTAPNLTMNATTSLVVQRLALDAAAFAIEREAMAGPRRLFTGGSLFATDERSVRRQLAHLHARIFSSLVSEDAPELGDELELFHAALQASGDPMRAWTLTVAGMLGDLRAVHF